MVLGWIIVGTAYFSWSAVAVFLVLTGLTLCLGHSIGMHRKLIHNSFSCGTTTERVLIYLGTLVGLGGPSTMMHTHDMRDWAQRLPACHDFLSHQRDIVTDFWWQLHCKLHLDDPPGYRLPAEVTEDRFYKLLERTAMAQQLPVALLLFLVGGWGWVAWGVCGRVSVSIFGHWIVGYFAHNTGPRDWHIEGASVQGHNLPYLGLVTFGECWHNNHHAFPGSARLGLRNGQSDPGWLALKILESVGLVWNLQQPEDLPRRPELTQIEACPERSNPQRLQSV